MSYNDDLQVEIAARELIVACFCMAPIRTEVTVPVTMIQALLRVLEAERHTPNMAKRKHKA